jgi:type IV secretion system protein VirD4
MLGKETIDIMTASDTKGTSPSYAMNYQKLGRELMTKDELAAMDGGRCICQIRGVRPFFSAKYDITAHPRYKYLADSDEKNTLNVKAFVRAQREGMTTIRPEDMVEYFEVAG